MLSMLLVHDVHHLVLCIFSPAAGHNMTSRARISFRSVYANILCVWPNFLSSRLLFLEAHSSELPAFCDMCVGFLKWRSMTVSFVTTAREHSFVSFCVAGA